MAITKRTTKKTCRRTTANRNRRNAQKGINSELIASFLGSYLNAVRPAPCSDPSLEVLSRSQRLRITDLAVASGYSPKRWVRRAVENFLQDEAPILKMKFRRQA